MKQLYNVKWLGKQVPPTELTQNHMNSTQAKSALLFWHLLQVEISEKGKFRMLSTPPPCQGLID